MWKKREAYLFHLYIYVDSGADGAGVSNDGRSEERFVVLSSVFRLWLTDVNGWAVFADRLLA